MPSDQSISFGSPRATATGQISYTTSKPSPLESPYQFVDRTETGRQSRIIGMLSKLWSMNSKTNLVLLATLVVSCPKDAFDGERPNTLVSG